MENTSRVLGVIVIVTLLVVTILWQDMKILKLQSQVGTDVENLQTELFTKQMEVGRYEVALGILREEDSVAANKFQLILDTQTE